MPEPAHILIIDDDPVINRMTARIVENAGYRVTTGASGEEALRLAREAEPDLILLDVILPDVDGVEVCHRLKAAPPPSRPHIILLSGKRTAADAQAYGLESGADGYIARPVANRELLARIKAVLRLRQVEARLGTRTRELEEEVARRIEVEKELRESRARQIQQERLAAVGGLTTGLAHTFNNFLAGISLRLELALMNGEVPPNAQESLEKAQRQIEGAATLIEQLLDFSRQALLRPSRLDLAGFAQRQSERLSSALEPGMAVTFSYADGATYEVEGDRERLAEVFSNLAFNAREALPAAGTLAIELRMVTANTICSACQKPIRGKWIQLTFGDDGGGIPPTVMPHIFEPFFTTKVAERNGLGLSQVLGIVEQHRGHVTVQSETGKGTTINLYLPVARFEKVED